MAISELNCPSLEYVYSMTWAEFLIRLYAYKRREKKAWFKVREIAWYSLIGSHVDPKKIPKDKEKFIRLENKNTTTDLIKERIKEAQRKYFKEIEKQSKDVKG